MLRALKQTYANSYVGVPAGSIIAQILGSIDRLIIRVNDPYLLIDLLITNPDTAQTGYIPTEGGVTAELFEASGYDARAVVDEVQYSGLTKYVLAGPHALTVHYLDAGTIYPRTYISKVNVETGQPSYIFGYNMLKPGNAESLPMVAIVTMGHIGSGVIDNTYCAFGAQLVDPDPTPEDPGAFKNKFPYVGIVRVNSNDIDITSEQFGVWPLATLNSGRLDRMPQAMSLTSVGKDRLAWMQRYDYADPAHPDPIPQAYPEIVVYNATTGVHTRTELRDIKQATVGEPGAGIFNEYAHLGYCGNGVVLAALSYPDPAAPSAGNLIARSADYGATWTVLSHKMSDGFVAYEETWFTNFKAFVSYAPGKIWLYTINYSSQEVEMHYSEDYGVSWAVLPLVAGEQAIQNGFSQMTAVYDKAKKGTVICVTRYSVDKKKVYIDTYEGFSPNAKKLYTTQIAANIATSADFERAAAFFDRNAPMMPGYPGELGDSNAA